MIEKEKDKISASIQTLYQNRLEENISFEQYKFLSLPFEEKIKDYSWKKLIKRLQIENKVLI